YRGEYGLNQAILDLPIDRLSSGVPVKDVIAECEALARATWEKIPDDDPVKDRWDWRAQTRQIEDSCYGFIKKACGDSPRLIDTLPDDLLKLWREIEGRGGSPELYKKRGLGRGEWSVKDSGPAEEIPTVPSKPADDKPAPSQGKYRKLEFISASALSSI